MRDPRRERTTARAQSELLGFLLIFAVVVVTIALVGATGFTGLESAQEFQRTANAEGAFVAFADNVDDVIGAGVPSRTTAIGIGGGSLSLTTAETSITVTHPDGSSNTTTVTTRPLVYDSTDGTTITYRSGAVVREDGDSGILLREPGFVLTDDRVILPVVAASAGRGDAIGGTTDAAVRTRRTGVDLLASGPVDSVTLNVTSPRAAVWERYFERHADGGPVTNVDRDGDSVEATIETGRAYVSVHRIAVTFR